MTRLLIVAPNWLGDAVMALPAMADVRRASSGTTIAVAARPAVASLFALVKEVDEVAEIGGAHLSADIGLLLPNSFRSALMLFRSRVPERWGYRTDCRGALLTRAVSPVPVGVHQVEYYQHLMRALGFPSGASTPRLEATCEARNAGLRLLTERGWDGAEPLVALAPGGAYGGAKRWPAEHFAALARELATDGVRSVLVGSAADERTRLDVEKMFENRRYSMVDLVGRTDLPMLAGVLAHVRTLVANDSGVMHLGAALGVPTVGLFGPTDERLTAPRSTAPCAVLAEAVWCRPCMLRECPLDHRCMRSLSPAAVAAAARRLM